MIELFWNKIIEWMLFFFGKDGKLLLIVSMFMLMDLTSGLICAIKNKNLSSRKAREGFFKKLGLISTILFGYMADELISQISSYVFVSDSLIGVYVFGQFCSVYVCVNEGISIIENLACLDNKIVPKKIKEVFEKMNKEVFENE